MKRLILFFILLLAAVWLGLKIHSDPGYVLVTYQHWSLETTLWFAILCFLALFFVLFFLLRFLRKTSKLPQRIRGFFSQRHLRKANKLSYEGLCQLAEGEWKSSEKTLLQGVDISYMPLINYLAAAVAAQQQGHYEDRDNYLRQAYQIDSQAEMAIGLTQAQLQMSAKQWELALATLTRLHQISPHHRFVLQLLSQVYLQLKDWQNLQALLPKLRKSKALSAKVIDDLEQKAYFALLTSALATNDSQFLDKFWSDIPSRLQAIPEIVSRYVDYLTKTKQPLEAEALLRQVLKKNWNSDLVLRYGSVNADTAKQIDAAEHWLQEHGSEPALLICLGQLYARNQQWEKAKSALQQGTKMSPSPKAFYELGRTYEQLGDPKGAADCYRNGLVNLSRT
jgi:HemY protein